MYVCTNKWAHCLRFCNLLFGTKWSKVYFKAPKALIVLCTAIRGCAKLSSSALLFFLLMWILTAWSSSTVEIWFASFFCNRFFCVQLRWNIILAISQVKIATHALDECITPCLLVTHRIRKKLSKFRFKHLVHFLRYMDNEFLKKVKISTLMKSPFWPYYRPLPLK